MKLLKNAFMSPSVDVIQKIRVSQYVISVSLEKERSKS